MSDDLVERAILAMRLRAIDNASYEALARATIAVCREAVIEECAHVADSAAEEIAGINADRYWQSRHLADAIRALKEKTHE